MTAAAGSNAVKVPVKIVIDEPIGPGSKVQPGPFGVAIIEDAVKPLGSR